MSTVNQQEVLASFKLLAYMAKADGKLLDEERESLVAAFAEIQLPPGVTVESLLSEDVSGVSVDELLKEITSDTAQELVYQSAYTMANIDGECSPEEAALLDKIGKTFSSSRLWGKQEWLETLQEKAIHSSIPKQVGQIADPEKRELEVENAITDACFLNAVLGAFPMPGIAIAFDVLVYINQLDLAEAIGELWGYQRSRADLRKAFFGSIGMTGARVAVSNLAKFVPVLGMVVGATTSFASTWAVGKVADRYFAEGGQMDAFRLREAFQQAKQEGEEKYKEKASEIAAKQKEVEPQLKALAEDLKAGRISQDEYQVKVKELV